MGRRWYVDETYVKEKGRWCYLYRAIDREGNLVDSMLSATRDMNAAQRFFRSAQSMANVLPAQVTTDGHDSYPRAILETLGPQVKHRCNAYLNRRIERDHRAIKQRYYPMLGFGALPSAQRFWRAFEEVRQYFRPRRKRSRGTLRALRTLPLPFEPDENHDWLAWKRLYEHLLAAESAGLDAGNLTWYAEGQGAELLRQLNARVNEALGLDKTAQAAIRDLVHVRRALVDGQVGEAAVRPPERRELEAYARTLQAELDGFLEGDVAARHRVTVVHDADSGMVEVDLVRDTAARQPVIIVRAGDPTAKEFQKVRTRLREKRSQWVYFDRNLRMYEDTRTYLFKPMQRLHWTEARRSPMPAKSLPILWSPRRAIMTPPTSSLGSPTANTPEFRQAFIRKCHRLVGLAYRTLDPSSFQAAEETEITGELVRAMETLLA